jgi:hypothetical protein
VRAPEESGPVLMITPVLAVQHKLKLHNNSHDASLRALSVDKRCSVLTLSSRVFTKAGCANQDPVTAAFR